MKVKLIVNLGSIDQRRLGLDELKSVKEGDVIDVPDKAADALVKNAWAVPASEAKAAGK